jgi:two-component system sensor histidine kinase CreC
MPLGIRIFLVYFLFVGLTAWFVLGIVRDEIKPGVRQSTEEMLVDTAYLLAELLRDDVKTGTLSQGQLPELLRAYGQRRPDADIWGINKHSVSHRIYVTDGQGIVLLDSSGEATGQDYSRWNDVYLTLQGEYGARSSMTVEGDKGSTVMYVAAPIRDGDRIIGVVSVGKPNSTLQPYIDRSQRRLAWLGGALLVLGLVVGGLLTWWLNHSLGRLTGYARDVSEGRRATLPHFRGGELAELAQAVDSMRSQLEGKAYVENYVQNLTHELKSPLAAIRGAAELLGDDLPASQRQRFAANVENEALRMQQLIERLLGLAKLEQRAELEAVEAFAPGDLVNEWRDAHGQRLTRVEVRLENAIDPVLQLRGDRLLVGQALANLLDNALDFTPVGGVIRVDAHSEENSVVLRVFNTGAAIPEFALPRLTERFYSLPRPATERKSTGLGLSFVKEVAALHGGEFRICNAEGGVEASLVLPKVR